MDLTSGALSPHVDTLLVEEPLEIRVDGIPPLTTMRTPGHDLDLATGLLLTEGMLAHPGQITHAMHCVASDPQSAESSANVLQLSVNGTVVPPQARTLAGTSACGVCGTASIDDVRARLGTLRVPEPAPPSSLDLHQVLGTLSTTQRLFASTGGSHAAALFTGRGGALDHVVTREDVGRHNAVDKVIGAFSRELLHAGGRDRAWPLPEDTVLVTSSRAGFEIVQKAWVAGISTVVTVSAASTLAVQTAEAAGMTLIGMVRRNRANVYCLGSANTRSNNSGKPSG